MNLRRLVKRLVTPPLMLLAALVLLFEELAWDQLQRALHWLARFRLVARLEHWIADLPPWGIFSLFVVPAAALLPVKLLALYLLGSGHAAAGVMVLLAAKVTGTAIAARLFTLGREKLLSVRLFALGYRLVTALHQRVHAFLQSQPLWLALRRSVAAAATRLRALLATLKARVRRRRNWLVSRFLAVRTRLRAGG